MYATCAPTKARPLRIERRRKNARALEYANRPRLASRADPERSPLHDVRQPASAGETGGTRKSSLHFWTSKASLLDEQKAGQQQSAERLKERKLSAANLVEP